MVRIHVGLSSWIIADGNYENFHRGQETKFALEFYGPELSPIVGTVDTSLERQLGANYAAAGRVVYSSPEVWVVDFGVMAFREESPPEWAVIGTCLEGSIYLGIDPFFYFEGLHALPEMPPLTYRVLIQRIFLETTPWIPDPEGKFAAIPDESRTGFEEVEDTAVRLEYVRMPGMHHDPMPHLILECDILETGVSPVPH